MALRGHPLCQMAAQAGVLAGRAIGNIISLRSITGKSDLARPKTLRTNSDMPAVPLKPDRVLRATRSAVQSFFTKSLTLMPRALEIFNMVSIVAAFSPRSISPT